MRIKFDLTKIYKPFLKCAFRCVFTKFKKYLPLDATTDFERLASSVDNGIYQDAKK